MTGQGCIVWTVGEWMGSIPDGFQVLQVLEVCSCSCRAWRIGLLTCGLLCISLILLILSSHFNLRTRCYSTCLSPLTTDRLILCPFILSFYFVSMSFVCVEAL